MSTNPDRSNKCEVVEASHSLNPCQWLEDLVSNKQTGTGIHRMQLVSMKTNKATRQSWGIRSGLYAKKTLALNFCPICGENLKGLFAHLFEKTP